MTDSLRLTTALVASSLLHLLLAVLVTAWMMLTASTMTPPPTIEVDLAQLPAPKPAAAGAKPAAEPAASQPPPIPLQRQIVALPDQGEEKSPESTRLLSDRDNRVKEQQVKPGEPGRSDVAKRERAVDNLPERDTRSRQGANEKQTSSAAPANKEKKPPVAPLPRLDDLFANPGDLARSGLGKAEPEVRPTPRVEAKVSRDLLGGSGAAFSSRPGIADYLPDVREGNVTLLNTKAERFAPFVRRVATRIFQHMSIRLSQAARRGSVGSGRDVVAVEAVMSRQGRMLSARVLDQQVQTSLGVERELLNATRPETFFDSNPPDGAEGNDGNIHFILVVDLNVQSGVDPRSSRSMTGYHGIISVGLDALQRRG